MTYGRIEWVEQDGLPHHMSGTREELEPHIKELEKAYEVKWVDLDEPTN